MSEVQPAPADLPTRTVLFLQGPSSTLFARIADRLETAGIRSLRVNLCAGDQMFWRRAGAINYRGRLADWSGFVERLIARRGVTEIVLLGEERPHHRAAAAVAKAKGVTVIAVEMGYLRPDWVTVEYGGSGCNSHFPADPAHILRAAAALPEPDMTVRYRYTFWQDATKDLLFNLPNVFFWFLFPHYRWHALYHPLAEYYGWLRRLIGAERRSREAKHTMDQVLASGRRLFIYPLQLETDYQIRVHSPFIGQMEAVEAVLGSFARSAPPDADLVVKLHPLDNGLVDWHGRIMGVASRLGVGDRVHFLDGGDLRALLARASGCVAINSSAGLEALRAGVAMHVLGVAIYDVDGLTDRQPLDTFWIEPVKPWPELSAAFFRLLAASIQVRGNFYAPDGVAAAATAIALRIRDRRINQPGGFVADPPRHRPAKRVAPAAARP